MSKKHLTKQQQRRIAENKANINQANQGLVVANYGQTVDVETNIEQIITCHKRKNLPDLAVGDNVIFEVDTNSNTGIVTTVLNRRSLLTRNNKNKDSNKPIAANLDQLFIVIAPEPEPQSYLIDQFVIIAEISNITPIIVLNKSDLLTQSNRENIQSLVNIYKNIGYQTLTLCSHSEATLRPFKQFLEDKSSVLVGQSGVGKSTITQSLLSEINSQQNVQTGALSDKAQLGKHTTTTARLYHLPNNSMLIDAPGIREMGVTHLSRQEIEQSYKEFRPFLGQCKFRDCKHQKEPDCALKLALSQQKIHQTRWDNYIKIVS